MTEKDGEKESKRNTSAMAAIYTKLVPRGLRTNKASVSRVERSWLTDAKCLGGR